MHRGGDGAKASGKGPKKFKNQKEGMLAQVKGSSSGGAVQVVQVVKKPQQKKGKGGLGNGEKKTKRGGHKRVQCHNCGGDHFLWDCKEWKEIKEKLCATPRENISPTPFAHTGGSPGWNP